MSTNLSLDSSLHTHNNYCDGDDSIEQMIQAAIAAGLGTIGISSHAPLPFETDWTMKRERLDDYRREVRLLREKYKDQIEVLTALELDFVPHVRVESFQEQFVFPLDLDYLIGSVHYLGRDYPPLEFDGRQDSFRRLLHDAYEGSIETMVADYYARVRALAEGGRVQIIGHIDRIKRWNVDAGYFREDEEWYRAEVERTLDYVSGTGALVEVNTSGLRNGLSAAYPSPWIVESCFTRGIPLIMTADAHRTSEIAWGFEQAREMLELTKQDPGTPQASGS